MGKAVQQNLARSIRDPQHVFNYDAETERRLAVYQSLFINNIDGFLSNGFPVLKSLLDNLTWDKLVRSFFVEHHCRSPYFVEIAKEFIEYLSGEPQILSSLPACASELAHYEWLELDISVRQGDAQQTLWKDEGIPPSLTLSHFASVVSYQFPVHIISVDFIPEEPSDSPHYYVVYRNNNFDVKFVELAAPTAYLLSLLENATNGLTTDELYTLLHQALPQWSLDDVRSNVDGVLRELLHLGVIFPA